MQSSSTPPKPHITSMDISDVERRRRILYVLLAGTALAATAILLILLFLVRATPNRSAQDMASLLWATAAVFIFTVGIYALARWISVDAASTVFLVLMTIGAALADDPIEVIHGRSLITFAIPILAASVLLRPWASFLFAGLSCVVIMVIGRQTGIMPNLLALVVFFLLALISWIFAHNLRRSNEDLAYSNTRIQQQYSILQGIIESSDASIYSVDRQYKYTSFNNARAASMAQIYGANIAMGQSALGYITNENDKVIAGAQLDRALGGASFTEVTVSGNESAGPRYFEVAHSPIIDAAGAIIGVAVVSRDVTAQRLAEQHLREMNEELELRVAARTSELQMTNQALSRASKAKDEFLATMSHELRTPLTSILGLTELLETGLQGSLTEKQLKSVRTIHSSGEHLLQLINDVLDLSKIEAGRLALERATVAVAEIAEASLQLVGEQAKQKEIHLALTQSPTGMLITGDRRRLVQVLVNLLDNAVKFTPVGGSVGLDITGDPVNESIAFTVWDTGIGINESDMPRLFQPFTQLDSRLARRHGGTGLGLALVRRMAEMHGGGVSVESTPEHGSRFIATLPWSPVAMADQTDAGLTTVASAPVDERPLNEVLGRTPVVLLAEDSPASAAIIAEYLELAGCAMVRAEHGEAALRQAEATHPDLVLMDIQMPQMDGLEATQRLRTHHDSTIASIPVIALTALAMPGDRERCLNAGANAYLRKPFNLRMLRDAVRVQLLDRPAEKARK